MFGKIATAAFGLVLASALGAGVAMADDCSVPADKPTITAALADPACTRILVTAATAESVAIADKHGVVIEAVPADCSVGVTPPVVPSPGSNYHAFTLADSTFITIRGFDVTGWAREAIYLHGRLAQPFKGNADVTIDGNCIHHNGSGSNNGGIFIARTNPRTQVINNSITDNGRNGIVLESDQAGAALDPQAIACNTILRNAWNGVSVGRMLTTAPGEIPDVPGKVDFNSNVVCYNGTATGATGGRYGLLYEASNFPKVNLGRNLTLRDNVFYGNHGPVSSSSSLDLGNWKQTCADGADVDNATTSATETTCDAHLAVADDCDVLPPACPISLLD